MTPERLAELRDEFEAACATLPQDERPNLDWRPWGQYRVLYTRAMFAGWLLAVAHYFEGEA